MSNKLILRFRFMEQYYANAAKELGIELVVPPRLPRGLVDEIGWINDQEDCLGCIYLEPWVGPYEPKAFGKIRHKKIYWSSEDPNHYLCFCTSAIVADCVFTTAEERVRAYMGICPGRPVNVLMWGCDPLIHTTNGHDPDFQMRDFDIVFIGNRYPNCKARTDGERDVLLPAIDWAREHGKNVGVFGYGDFSEFSWREILSVWDDPFHNPRDRVRKNSDFRPTGDKVDRVAPSLFAHRNPAYQGSYQYYTEHHEVAGIYNNATVVICINEQIDSPTMVSMRTFEALCCGNVVLSHLSLATSKMFGDYVYMANSPTETRRALDTIFGEPVSTAGISAEAAMKAEAGRECVLAEHTYTKRLQQIRETIS